MKSLKTQNKKPALRASLKKASSVSVTKKSSAVKKKITKKVVTTKAVRKNFKTKTNQGSLVGKAPQKKNQSISFLRVSALLLIIIATVVVFVKAFATKLEAPEVPVEKTQEKITREMPRPVSPPSVKNENGLYRNEQMGIQFKYPEQKILVDDGVTKSEGEIEDGDEASSIATGKIYRDIPNQLFPSSDLSEYMKEWDANLVSRIEGDKKWFCMALKGEKKGKQCYTQLGKTVYQFDYYQDNRDLFSEDEFNEILKSVDIIS